MTPRVHANIPAPRIARVPGTREFLRDFLPAETPYLQQASRGGTLLLVSAPVGHRSPCTEATETAI